MKDERIKIQQLSFGMKSKRENIPVKQANKISICRNLPLEIIKYYVNL